MDISSLKERCRRVRRDIITMTSMAGSGHPGGSLSCTELMVAAYDRMNVDPQNPKDPNRDRFALSKGHCAPALYALLCDMGYYSRDEYDTFRKLGGMLQGHPSSKRTPGVDVSTGSLGQGVSMAAGMALGAKHQGKDIKVYTLLGDGELQEGLVWEAFMAAAHFGLDNLTIMIDNNGLQIDGANDEVMALGDIRAKAEAFGLDVIELADGNDLEKVLEAIDRAPTAGKPKCILAHTIKGKGVSFMENQAGWHGKAPNAEQRDAALAELEV
jgi:Transketolase, N-terminal subunit